MVEEDDARAEALRYGLDADTVDLVVDVLAELEESIAGPDLELRARYFVDVTTALVRARSRVLHPSTPPDQRVELERRARTFAAAALILASRYPDGRTLLVLEDDGSSP